MENETYEQFVSSRVKWMPTFQADLMHASVGIVGELIELAAAPHRANILEELADVEFYLTHMVLAFEKAGISFLHFSDGPRERMDDDLISNIANALFFSGNLLDYAKKMWVYNKPPMELLSSIAFDFQALLECLHSIHECLATSRGVLRANNEAKLRTRYPVGYNDAHAQARLDKPAGQ